MTLLLQEEIRDLLAKDQARRLELKERPDTGVYVKVRGNAARGNAARGNAARGNAARGNAARGNAARGNAARGNAARGNAARGNAARGNAARASFVCPTAASCEALGQFTNIVTCPWF